MLSRSRKKYDNSGIYNSGIYNSGIYDSIYNSGIYHDFVLDCESTVIGGHALLTGAL